jgi:hypothetical protein
MKLARNYIVYHAYNSRDIHNEIIYSIASYYEQLNKSDVSVVVYTDNKDYISRYLPENVIIEELSDRKIKQWLGSLDFVHRVKIEVLIDFCSKYSGNILYLDSDTIFTKSADDLFSAIHNDIFIMHTSEGKLSITRNKLFDKIVRFLKSKSFEIEGKSISISLNQEIWNAGVIGFNSKNAFLLNEVLSLTDNLYQQYQKHIMEQIAFSCVLPSRGLIASAENHIFHYWNFKEFRSLLNEFIIAQNTFEKIRNNYTAINPARLMLPKLQFEKQPHLIKQFKKHVLRKRWYLPVYSQINGS